MELPYPGLTLSFFLSGNGYIEGKELDNFLIEFATVVMSDENVAQVTFHFPCNNTSSLLYLSSLFELVNFGFECRPTASIGSRVPCSRACQSKQTLPKLHTRRPDRLVKVSIRSHGLRGVLLVHKDTSRSSGEWGKRLIRNKSNHYTSCGCGHKSSDPASQGSLRSCFRST